MFYNFDSNNMLATLKKVNLEIDPLTNPHKYTLYKQSADLKSVDAA